MNKNQLIDIVADKSSISKPQVKELLELFLSSITYSLKQGETVQLVGFGTFKVHDRPERLGRNPKSGEEIKIAAKRLPSFTSGKILKESVNS
jgi:DNA-binding protein HU-alpha